MKKEFRAHPLMIVSLMRPFLFVLVLPVLKGVVQYTPIPAMTEAAACVWIPNWKKSRFWE